MKKIISFIAVICILSLLLATESLAQSERKWEGNKRWEAKRQSSRRRYDPKTVETIRGEVISVDKISSRQGILYLIMKTDKGAIDVQLGPAWYMEKQKIKIEPKDKIEVRAPESPLRGNRPSLLQK